jgi:sigma-B regulation protein RsbU (phosphoserine phosphatase)
MPTVAPRIDAPLQHNSVKRSSPGDAPIRLRLPAGPSPDVAIAVLTAKRPQMRSEFARLEREFAEARRQQLAMMPRDFLSVSGGHRVDMHAVTYPAREVGGDLYDAFEVAPGVICIAVGDVAGTGLPAALFMARARSVLRAVTLQFIAITGRIPATSDVARIVNAELCKDNDDCMFMTLFIGLLDLGSGRLGFTNAGHVRPYLVRPYRLGGGLRIERLDSAPDLPLGVIAEAGFADGAVDLAVGDGLVALSDGLPETINSAGAFYSLERIVADLAELADAAPRTLTTTLIERIHRFAGSAGQTDDLTMLALRRRA